MNRAKFIAMTALIGLASAEAGAGEIYPIFMLPPAEVCKGVTYRDVNGALQDGAKDCVSSGVADCASDGQSGCRTTATHKAAKMANFTAAKITTGTTVAGVTGTGSGPATCSADGGSNCVVDGANYKAASVSNLTAGNIKDGVTIGGVGGLYPNATYTLPGSSGATAALTSATFNAQMKSSAVFEWWDSTGARQTGSGDTNIVASKIAASASIFGTTGSLTSPNKWDLRAGRSVVTATGTLTGKLPVNCRNTANLTLYDAQMPAVGVSGPAASSGTWTITDEVSTVAVGDKLQLIAGTPPVGFTNGSYYFVLSVSSNTFQLSATSGGAVITASSAGSGTTQLIKMGGSTVDIWDTIDDYNANNTALPSQLVSGWSIDTQCVGIESAVDDSNVWRDVTTTGDGETSSTCSGSGGNCSYLDKISGLEWSKKTSKKWADAVTYCDGLTHNGKTDWRIPTQKELMNAAEHGIHSTKSANFVSNFNTPFWSGSTVSDNTDSAWLVYLAHGSTYTNFKHGTGSVICVRP
jgi:hypothetical protein